MTRGGLLQIHAPLLGGEGGVCWRVTSTRCMVKSQGVAQRQPIPSLRDLAGSEETGRVARFLLKALRDRLGVQVGWNVVPSLVKKMISYPAS